MKLKFSEGLMKKWGALVHEDLDSRWSLRKLLYRLSWKSKKLTNLVNWAYAQTDSVKAQKIALDLLGRNDDETMRKILNWVHKNIRYVGDKQVWQTPEYWQTVDETLTKRTGDCEDGAILIMIMGRLAGITPNKIRVAAGDVKGGGHAWCMYRCDYDGTWKYLDWCYWFDHRIMRRRPSDYELSNYYNIWFSFNDQKGYGKWRK